MSNSKTHITGITDLLTFSDPSSKEEARKEEIHITNSGFKLSPEEQEDVEKEFKRSIQQYNDENGIDLGIDDESNQDMFSVMDEPNTITDVSPLSLENNYSSEDMLAELESDNYTLNNNKSSTQSTYKYQSDPINYKDNNFRKLTDDQRKQNITDSVINDVVPNMDNENGGDYESAYKLRDDDRRAEMLKDISELRNLIGKSGHQVDDLPQVDSNADIRDIERCYQSHRKYYDDIKFSNTSDDWVKIFAFGLEYLFDGKKTYFGQFSPDLTDYYKTIQTKTRFMRYDLSRTISKFSRKNNIHWIGSAIFTLIPSMIVYSRQKNVEKKYDIEMEMENQYQQQQTEYQPQQPEYQQQTSPSRYRNHTRARISNRINDISQYDYQQSYNPMAH